MLLLGPVLSEPIMEPDPDQVIYTVQVIKPNPPPELMLTSVQKSFQQFYHQFNP